MSDELDEFQLKKGVDGEEEEDDDLDDADDSDEDADDEDPDEDGGFNPSDFKKDDWE